MKRQLVVLVLLLCLLLSGCDRLFDGYYSSVKPHEQQSSSNVSQNVSASNYNQLYTALTRLIQAGRENGVISVGGYDRSVVEADMEKTIANVMKRNAIAAYAVEDIHFELGKSGGEPALDVHIKYTHNRAEILKIKHVDNVAEAITMISGALNQCQTHIVMQIDRYEQTDFVQVVENYALECPQYVMELPRVTVNISPETGATRVVELRFTYQTSRDSLRSMQDKVQPVFESAMLYVSGDADETEKYDQLYSFLMERYEYQIQTSITPSYSLLRHGVGDSRAFASVYAAMCRQAGLECLLVSGTQAGESHYWNIICDDGIFYHVNLLEGRFQKRTDEQMTGFVWDYSAFPACGVIPEE
jgi:hypothetical protein